MDTKELISVIVPVYNVKPFLEKCFDSIVRQSYQNLEIILVDDGSTDGSGNLCEELAHQDNRVRVIHKKNGGLGSARNAGIGAANGEILSFVDSDDWIEPGMYDSMMRMLCRENAQIIACGIKKVSETGAVTYYQNNLEESCVYTREEALIELPKNERLSNSMCNKLFRRETIEGLHINEQIFYEDNPFTPQCFARAERIAYTAEPFYCYFERAGSISRKQFSVREFDRVTADRMRLDYYHEFFPQCEHAAAIAYIGSGLKVYCQSRGNPAVKEQRAQLREEMKRTIRSYPNLPFTEKQGAKAKLFLLSPALYTVSMKLRGK